MTTLSDKTVITRKPCVCYGCAREMPKGSKIRKIVVREDGKFIKGSWTACYFWCMTCDEYISNYDIIDFYFSDGALKENDPEGWEEMRQEVEGK